MEIGTRGCRGLEIIYIEGGGKYHTGQTWGARGSRVIHQEPCSCGRDLLNLAQAAYGIY